MRINQLINPKRREALASFFSNVAVGWFVAAFITPGLGHNFDILTTFSYIVMMILSLGFALMLLPSQKI